MELEGVTAYTNDGLEAILFVAEGGKLSLIRFLAFHIAFRIVPVDLRNALNSLQATYAGFGNITSKNVFKVHRFIESYAQ